MNTLHQTVRRALRRLRPPGALLLLIASLLLLLNPGATFGQSPPPTLIGYVSNYNDDTVSVIALDTLTVTATISVGDGPQAIVAAPDGSRVYVANALANSVSVIDAASRTVVATIAVGTAPSSLAVNHDGSRVYVANSGSASVSVISAAAASIETTITTPAMPSAVSYHPVRDELWLGFGAGAIELLVLSATDFSELARIQGGHPYYGSGGLEFTADGNVLFGTEGCGCCGRFHKLSGNPVGGTVEVLASGLLSGGGWAAAVAIHPSNGSTYFAQYGHCATPPVPRLTEILASGANRTLTLSSEPRGLAITPDGNRLFVVHGNSLLALDTVTLSQIGEVAVGVNPQRIAIGVAPAAHSVLLGNLPSNDKGGFSWGQLGVAFSLPPGTPYAVTSLRVRLQLYSAAQPPVYEIRADDGSGNPGQEVLVTFAAPPKIGDGPATYTYTPATTFTMLPSTVYWLVGHDDYPVHWLASDPPVVPTGIATVQGSTTRYRFPNWSAGEWKDWSMGPSFELEGTPATVLSVKMYAGLTITGVKDARYRIEYSPAAASPPDWQTLTTITLPSSPFLFIDENSPGANSRFYRATLLP